MAGLACALTPEHGMPVRLARRWTGTVPCFVSCGPWMRCLCGLGMALCQVFTDVSTINLRQSGVRTELPRPADQVVDSRLQDDIRHASADATDTLTSLTMAPPHRACGHDARLHIHQVLDVFPSCRERAAAGISPKAIHPSSTTHPSPTGFKPSASSGSGRQ